MNDKSIRNYVKYLESVGLTVEHGGKHLKVRKDGALVATISGTSGPNTTRVNIRHLVAAGHLPESAKRLKF